MKKIFLPLILSLILTMLTVGCSSSDTAKVPAPAAAEKTADAAEQLKTTAATQAANTTSKTADSGALNVETSSLTTLQQRMTDTNSLCAVAFIGYTGGISKDSYYTLLEQNGYFMDYPFIAEIPVDRMIEWEGDELYCIVPRDVNASVAVNAWVTPEGNGQQGYAGEVLYRSESSEPILVRGNLSELVSNLQINIVNEDGSMVTLYPSLNLMDGRLLPTTGVLDFSNYPLTVTAASSLMDNPSYSTLIQNVTRTNSLCAVAFIGYTGGISKDSYYTLLEQNGYFMDYPFIAEIPVDRMIEWEGDELYCIVPRDLNASVAVNAWITPEGNGQQGYAGEVLYRSESGEPILVRGNLSELVSNLQINIVNEDGSMVTLYPARDMMDSLLIPADGVFDFTIYG